MTDKLEAPEGSGITFDDEGVATGSAGDLARYHAGRGEYAAAIAALADKVDPHKSERTSSRGE